jgi:hypothetical protein
VSKLSNDDDGLDRVSVMDADLAEVRLGEILANVVDHRRTRDSLQLAVTDGSDQHRGGCIGMGGKAAEQNVRVEDEASQAEAVFRSAAARRAAARSWRTSLTPRTASRSISSCGTSANAARLRRVASSPRLMTATRLSSRASLSAGKRLRNCASSSASFVVVRVAMTEIVAPAPAPRQAFRSRCRSCSAHNDFDALTCSTPTRREGTQ